MIQKDGTALDKLLSSNLTYVHSGGQLETKSDAIKGITSKKTIVERVGFTGTTVRFYGDTTLVKCNVDVWHSKTNIVHMNVLHIWTKSGSSWQMVARQSTRLAP